MSETPAIAEVATSQVALDITLLAQRQKRDVQHVMARMLGHRVGRLDTLLGGQAVERDARTRREVASSRGDGRARATARRARRLRRSAPRHARAAARARAGARGVARARLPLERKVEHLFELEILLKGLACFANPRNHPGPPRKTPVVAQDFREHAALVREALGRAVHTCRLLLVEGERAFVFQRYLETVLPDDRARTRLLGDVARAGHAGAVAVRAAPRDDEPARGDDGAHAAAARAVPALLRAARRGAARDRAERLLQPAARAGVPPRVRSDHQGADARADPVGAGRAGAPARRADVALALPDAALPVAGRAGGARDDGLAAAIGGRGVPRAERACVPTRARSPATCDAAPDRCWPRASSGCLPRSARRRSATEYERLLARGHELRDIKATLEGVAANLRLEMRRAFERDFPSLDLAPAIDELRASVLRLASNLRPALQNAVMFLGSVARGAPRRARRLRRRDGASACSASGCGATSGCSRRSSALSRSRRARSTPEGQDRWAGVSPLAFVREFMSYFRAMGYPLLRTADYPRVDAFLARDGEPRDADLLDPARLDVRGRGGRALPRLPDRSSSRRSARREELAGVAVRPTRRGRVA